MDDVRLIDAAALRDKILHEAYEKSNETDFDRGMIWAFNLAVGMIDHAATIDHESLRPVSEWELNPHRFSCEHFRCKECHHIDCVADNYCGKCGARMKNAGVKPEELPIPEEENSRAKKSDDGNGEWEECGGME